MSPPHENINVVPLCESSCFRAFVAIKNKGREPVAALLILYTAWNCD